MGNTNAPSAQNGDPNLPIASRELTQFQQGSLVDFSKTQDSASSYADLFRLRVKDIKWRIENRKRYGALLLFLLFAQNIIVFGLVIVASVNGSLKDLQLVLGILTTSTLAETIASVNIIVKWLFNDIDYTQK